MASRYTRSQVKKEINNVFYLECGGFEHGVLPTKKDIVQNMLYLLRPDRAGKSKRTMEVELSVDSPLGVLYCLYNTC